MLPSCHAATAAAHTTTNNPAMVTPALLVQAQFGAE